MADNVNLPLTGSGDSTAAVAAEDIGGVHYQRVKIINAAAGSTAAASLASTSVDATLTSAGSTRIIGLVDGIPMTVTRATANTSAEVQLFAANSARRAVMIQNLSTAAELLVGLSTNTVSTALANVQFKVALNAFVVIGGQLGNIPLYTGAIRGRINSTTLAGPIALTEFT
jgi:hypothetical protein